MGGYEELFDGSLAVSPPLDDATLAKIPGKRGIFLLLASDGRPILLISAADIRSRLRFRLTAPEEGTRTKAADLREITAKICWRLTSSAFETDWQFFELARAIYPDRYEQLIRCKAAWFVAVRAEDEFPRFVRTQNFLLGHQQFGPFPDGSSAERFIEYLTDAFDLCRYYNILRQAPHGTPCAYKQMGRSPAPCDGSIPMEQYRAMICAAAEFASGQRESHRQRLAAEMRHAAEEMRYEQAAVLKSRLKRLEDFDSPKFAQVRLIEEFRFVIVQPGPSARKLSSFVCDRGAVAAGPPIALPPKLPDCQEVLKACDALAVAHAEITLADRQRMGIITNYLFSAPQKRGLILRRSEIADDGALLQAAEAFAKERKKHPRGHSPANQDLASGGNEEGSPERPEGYNEPSPPSEPEPE